MELYNFFSVQVKAIDIDKLEELKACFQELKHECVNVQLVQFKDEFSIIGQIYGDDTNVGDTTLLSIFTEINYTWFDARCPKINNIEL
jgi:hypothetical protein